MRGAEKKNPSGRFILRTLVSDDKFFPHCLRNNDDNEKIRGRFRKKKSSIVKIDPMFFKGEKFKKVIIEMKYEFMGREFELTEFEN